MTFIVWIEWLKMPHPSPVFELFGSDHQKIRSLKSVPFFELFQIFAQFKQLEQLKQFKQLK